MNVQVESNHDFVGTDESIKHVQEHNGPAISNPFNDEAVSGLFFPGAGRQEVLDQFAHLLRYGPSLLILYGDQGVGKHFLVDHLVSQLDTDLFDVAVVSGDIMTTADTLLASCSEAWHSRQPMTVESFLERSITIAGDADQESKILLCVIQRSQFLDEETCQVLVDMLASCAGLPVKFLLVVDAQELECVEQIFNVSDRIPDNYIQQLQPLTVAETEEYLNYRLRTAGLGQVCFSENQLDQIFNHSLGNLVRVNEVAHALLMSAMPKPKSKSKSSGAAPLPWLHIVALVLVASVLLVLFFVRSPEEQAAAVGSDTLALVESSQETVLPEKNANLSVEEPLVADSSAQNQASTASPDLRLGESKKALAPVSVSSESVQITQPAQIAEQVQTTPPVQLPKLIPKPSPVSKAKLVKPSSPLVDAPIKTAPKVVATPKPKPKVSPSKVSDERAAWILSLPKSNYSVQLLGAKELTTVNRFLSQYPSLQNLVYYQTQRKGAPWYVVVQGNYQNYDSAKAATLKYPAKLQKQGPWIRKVEAIQKDLKTL